MNTVWDVEPDPEQGGVRRFVTQRVLSFGMLLMLAFLLLVSLVVSVAGQFALAMYLGRSEPGSAFGAAGALALLLVWIYYSAVVLFLGAEFTHAYATGRGDGVEPADGAVRVVQRRERGAP